MGFGFEGTVRKDEFWNTSYHEERKEEKNLTKLEERSFTLSRYLVLNLTNIISLRFILFQTGRILSIKVLSINQDFSSTNSVQRLILPSNVKVCTFKPQGLKVYFHISARKTFHEN